MRTPAGTATPRRQSGLPRARMSRQVNQQRRGYAQAVLGALARSQRGRPTPQIQRVLRDALPAGRAPAPRSAAGTRRGHRSRTARGTALTQSGR
jgi:hypothetical protein